MPMRRIVAGLFMSVDGVIESPDRFVFPYFSEEVGNAVSTSIESSDAVLMGRQTYEEWAAYWPDVTPEQDDFSSFINPVRKYVVSSSLTEVGWNNASLITGDDVAGQIRALKEEDGQNIGMSGSGTLVSWLLKQGLLDELSLLVFPIAMGSGRRLFADEDDRVALELLEERRLDTGVLWVRYARASD